MVRSILSTGPLHPLLEPVGSLRNELLASLQNAKCLKKTSLG